MKLLSTIGANIKEVAAQIDELTDIGKLFLRSPVVTAFFAFLQLERCVPGFKIPGITFLGQRYMMYGAAEIAGAAGNAGI